MRNIIEKISEKRYSREDYFNMYLAGLQNKIYEPKAKTILNLSTWFRVNYTVKELDFSFREGIRKHPAPGPKV